MEFSSAYIIGGTSVALCVLQSLFLLFQHLRNFIKPEFQLYICRIILMVPLYCITSCLSMINPEFSQILDMCRDCYEAFVIYSFTMLLMNYVGGERKLSMSLELKERINHPWPFNSLFMSFYPNGTFLRLVKIGVLHFVFFRPLLSALGILMQHFDLYHDNKFSVDDAYLYIFILNNISFSLALYGLLLFYVATEELLEPYKPLPKFLCIKGVIFFSFWQGIALSIMQHAGIIKKTENMSASEITCMLQNLLVCIEMVIASFAHSCAFGYEEYTKDLEKVRNPLNKDIAESIKSIFSAQDVIEEVKFSISPKEYDFELQNDN